MIKPEKEVAVLVMSCDGYSDVWEPFFTLFFRYWSDCPFQIYLCTDSKHFPNSAVTHIHTGVGKSWCEMLRLAAEQIPQRYILILQEDFLLKRKVKTAELLSLTNILITEQAACLRIFPEPGADLPFKHYAQVGVIAENADWRVSCQATIWDKHVLLNIVRDTETIQEFEVRGSKWSNSIKTPFLALFKVGEGDTEDGNYPLTYICTGVVQRRWIRRAIQFLDQEGIKPALDVRGIETNWTVRYRSLLFSGNPNKYYFQLHVMDFIAHRLKKHFNIDIREVKK